MPEKERTDGKGAREIDKEPRDIEFTRPHIQQFMIEKAPNRVILAVGGKKFDFQALTEAVSRNSLGWFNSQSPH